MRYIQRVNADGTSRFDEVGTSPRVSSGAFIGGDIESFVSPVDGTIISDRKQLREHNKRNKVENIQEFEGVKKPVTGEHTSAQKLARKQEIYETIMRAERKG
jgi:hypothetical protein